MTDPTDGTDLTDDERAALIEGGWTPALIDAVDSDLLRAALDAGRETGAKAPVSATAKTATASVEYSDSRQ